MAAPGPPAPLVQLCPAAAAVILDHARRERPGECCGVLVGTAHQVAEAHPARNLSDDPNRFVLDPVGHIDTRRLARARGLDVVGFYHSHPHSAAVPSARDREEAGYEGYLYAIVSLATEPPDIRVFRLHREGFQELAVERV